MKIGGEHHAGAPIESGAFSPCNLRDDRIVTGQPTTRGPSHPTAPAWSVEKGLEVMEIVEAKPSIAQRSAAERSEAKHSIVHQFGHSETQDKLAALQSRA